MNILVLCTGNSARSILLEAILNARGMGRVAAYSAGSKPAGQVHPLSTDLLSNKGIDASGARSKSWDEFAVAGAPDLDLVITVCGNADKEVCPIWPGAPMRTHWGVEDPAAAAPEAAQAAFREAFEILERRASAFLDLEFEGMARDALKPELDRIGRLP